MTPMQSPTYSLRFGRRRDWFWGVLLFSGLIVIVQMTSGWQQLLAPWRTLSPSLILLLFGCMGLSYVLRALRIYDDLYAVMRGRFTTTLRLSVLHTTANVLLPMRLGEVVFPWLMRRYFGHDVFAASASLVWIRVLDLHFLGLTALAILWLRQPSWLWIVIAGLWLLLLFAQRWIGRIGRQFTLPDQQYGRLLRGLLVLARAAPDDHTRIARLYLWTALSWLIKLIAFTAVLQHFLPLDFWQLLVGVMGTELSSVLPFYGIAGSGSYELAMVAALVPLGVTATDALAGAVNLHLFMLGSSVLLGMFALLLRVQSPPAQ